LKEIKRVIVGYPEYEVSIWGNIFHNGKQIKVRERGKNSAYYRVDLYNSAGKKTFSVNRLVAEAFIPNPENKPEVNHIDGNVHNNSITNLEWVTHEENIQHRIDIKTNDYTDTLFPEYTMQLQEKMLERKWLNKDKRVV